MRALVVGAGIGGLACAVALSRRGIDTQVVERATEWEPAGTGLYLPANAVRALGELGVAAAVEARANRIRRQYFLDHRGRPLAEIDVDRFWIDIGPCVAIHRAALHEALREAAAGVPVALGTSVAAVEDGDVPRVSLSDGSQQSYDFLVGADGVHSTVRSSMPGGHPARPVGQASWRFVVDGFADLGDWRVMLGRGRAFLTVALGEGSVYCYADVDARDAPAAGRDEWRTLFDDFAGPVPGLLEGAGDAYYAPIEEVVPPVWRARRVVLVGDAAHASSPNMAQGAAMALEDALVLADQLQTAGSIDEALIAYEQRRVTRVTWVQEQTHRRDRTRNLPSPIRNLTLRLAAERIHRSNYRPLRDPP
jgi:2-polyprenyl-6-methoxyphenol hydroxylase-like FAD-dependent oxidoreductase